ncbi:MAG: multicopper oxidase domain-containing protein [Corynebacterium sp.]|uniref:multicopper oxidase domain-containing protein n=1 Tax=Corynebacterium sp. TaxID=1720 RepID=UPI0026DFCD9E|nr:multicopper oxidase domain-containing protein [Corynebacterium sp.]MDO5670468.1 multicopper oxidase domain-containing protein [Corynebacterium sp.]
MTLPLGSSPARPSTPEDEPSVSWAAWLLVGLSVAAAIVLGVTLSTTAPDGPAPAVSGEPMTVEVSMRDMNYHPNVIEVPAGTHLLIELRNDDDMNHDLQLADKRSTLLAPGNTTTFDAGVITQDIQGWCTVAGHKALGMALDVVVGAGGGPVSTDSLAQDATLPPAPAGAVHEVEWTVTEEMREVAPGHEQVVWLFDGQAPGPTLRGRVGDTFRLTLINDGTMGHSVDFHAGEVSPDTPMRTINPGESLVYEFVAHRSGIWMYHCATAPMSLHIAKGMFGAVIIDPPDLTPVTAEYSLIASAVWLGEKDGDHDHTAFNGFPHQYITSPLQARVGDTVRFWILDVGPDNPVSFHLVGEIFDTVFSEGQYLIRDAEDTGAQVLPLLPAQGGFVEVTFDEPGTYTFVNHVMTDAEKGQRGQIVVS